MSNLPDDTHLAYVVSHEAWYAATPGLVRQPSMYVSASAKGGGGGVAWEFEITEHDHGSDRPIRVCVFSDAFIAYVQIPAFFAALASGKVRTLDQVRATLDEMGAADETQRVSPYPYGDSLPTVRDKVRDGLESLALDGGCRISGGDRDRIADFVTGLLEPANS